MVLVKYINFWSAKIVNTVQYIFLVLMILVTTDSAAQKPLDYQLLENFEMIGDAKISNNGSYAAYRRQLTNYNYVHGEFYKPAKGKIFFQSTIGDWKFDIPDGQDFGFTQDSRFGLFKLGADSLGTLKLGSNIIEYHTNVDNWKVPNAGTSAFIAVLDRSGKLLVRNLASKKSWTFHKVVQYEFAPSKDVLVLEDEKGLYWLDLNAQVLRLIYPGRLSGVFKFNRKEDQLVFLAEYKGTRNLFLFQKDSKGTQRLANESQLSLSTELALNDVEGFLSDDHSLLISYISISPEKSYALINNNLKLETYLDASAQPELVIGAFNKITLGVKKLNNKKELLIKSESSDVWLVTDTDKKITAAQWLDGRRKAYPEFQLINNFGFKHWLSPNGKFLVYLNFEDKEYYSLELENGVRRMISANVKADWFGKGIAFNREIPQYNNNAVENLKWYSSGSHILVKDRVGYWRLDLNNLERPQQLFTKAKGYEHIIFRSLNWPDLIYENSVILANSQDTLTKGTGLCLISLKGHGAIQTVVRTNSSYNLAWSATGYTSRAWVPPLLKARDKNVYLFSRQSSTEIPNYFSTSDNFRSSKQLSEIKLDTAYNWPRRAELHHFERMDGGKGVGVLYKPKNFNPYKRYPLVMFYYERMSDALNCFKQPDMPSEGMDVAWMVSHGYLVFVPDIFYTIGHTAQSVYDNLEGAARYVSNLPFVDSAKLGMAGHSWGGYETNVMLTRSKRFAAAYSSAGPANFTGPYHITMSENNQHRMGRTLWDIPELYLESSPVFHADKVTTPVLFLGNSSDVGLTPHVLQFFTGLKRLGKLCWLMDYKSGRHGMDWLNCRVYEDRKDHTTRVMQFFDHYLKGAAAPLWMLEHTQDKTLDVLGRTPQKKQFNQVEQNKIDEYSQIPLGDKLKRVQKSN